MGNKNTDVLFKRFKETRREMEARLCVMRLCVYCIYTGHWLIMRPLYHITF